MTNRDIPIPEYTPDGNGYVDIKNETLKIGWFFTVLLLTFLGCSTNKSDSDSSSSSDSLRDSNPTTNTDYLFQQEGPPFNVIYITVDDLGPFLGCYGYKEVISPNLDRFAEQSVMFTDVHCQVALCTPSRTSILTGIRPTTSGIVKINDPWKEMIPEARSLPMHFRKNDYNTYATGKIYDLRSGGLEESAFDFDDPNKLTDNQRALELLEMANKSDKPFFAAIGYSQVHTQWQPSERSKRLYDLDEISIDHMSKNYGGQEQTPEETRKYVRDYYADITDVDSLIGGVLGKIEDLGLLERSVILVGSMDHGYSLGWHGKWGKGNNYDMETQVPLFIRVPGLSENGTRCNAVIELLDLYPTLVELCGLPKPPQNLEGTSLIPLLEEPGSAWKSAAFTTRAYHLNDFGIKTKEYTLVSREAEGVRLFDRKSDPFNLHDVSQAKPEVVEELLALRDQIL